MRPQVSLRSALDRNVLIFDGAMGTEIYRRNVFVNQCFDELSLIRPDLIRTIHEEYVAAGADVLTTNTYGANAFELARFGLAESMREINAAGVRVARQAADASESPVYVVGSVGSLRLPVGSSIEAEPILAQQIGYLIEAGVDAIIFETLPSLLHVRQSLSAMSQAKSDFPFILSVAVNREGESANAEPLESILGCLTPDDPQPLAWGLNCGVGPDRLLAAIERACRVVELPLVVQPNAGTPREVGNRWIYMCSPEYIATYAQRFAELGVRGIGGCCGTQPEHIRAIASTVKPLTRKRVAIQTVAAPEGVSEKPESDFSERSRLACRLAMGKWVTSVELVPPRGYDLTDTIDKARLCHRHGVDAINIPDGPRASSRISPLVTAAMIRRDSGIEPILHFCCRDRNLIGMQADLFACAACGIRNLLFVTGDPPKLGNYPFASGVFDADSIGLAAIQTRLNRGVDIGGQAVDPQTHAVVGVGADPSAIDLQRELRRFREKVAAGAHFAITQPIFDPDALLSFLDQVQDTKIPVIAGIWPLASYRNALFMRNEIPGVVVPDRIMARMEAAQDRESQRLVGIEIAREAVERIRDRIAGIQVSAPFGNVRTALAVIEA